MLMQALVAFLINAVEDLSRIPTQSRGPILNRSFHSALTHPPSVRLRLDHPKFAPQLMLRGIEREIVHFHRDPIVTWTPVTAALSLTIYPLDWDQRPFSVLPLKHDDSQLQVLTSCTSKNLRLRSRTLSQRCAASLTEVATAGEDDEELYHWGHALNRNSKNMPSSCTRIRSGLKITPSNSACC